MKLTLEQIKSITFGAVRVEEEADGIHFYRFTKEQEELYRTMREKSLLVKTFATSGICFRFRTDSAILSFCGQTTPGSTRSYFSFELFVDGEKIGGVDNFVPESYPKGKPNVPFPLGEFSAEFELGEGEKAFLFTVVDKDGNETNFDIHTDKEVVGDALLELGLIAGEDGQYGLYVKTVNGIVADYDVDGTYWAFYINGEYAMSGVDTTPINEGETYSFKVEK